MSFNVINPYQIFYDSNGSPRAGGFVTFFVNTTSTVASIYSDESLTVAQSNPYELDAYGRITGDVKYSGLMTLQVTNSDGSDVILTDNVTTTEISDLLRSDLASITDATKGSFLVGVFLSATGYVGRKLSAWITSRPYYTSDFGAVGGGADDTTAIQNTLDAVSSGGVVIHDAGDSRVSKQSGTNDKWGLKITNSNITFKCKNGSTIRRLSSDITTYAKAFPILLIGVPDDNNTQITDIDVCIDFVGEDTRHSTSGNALMDGRQAVWVKNAKNVNFYNGKFDQIDSSAIWVQTPGEYDYENSAYYNTTKCYNIKIHHNDFIAASHSTNGRALLHAIVGTADFVEVTSNYFEWCDDCFINKTTYDDYDDVETDTYTDSNLSASVKRVGRGCAIHANTFYNSSEHCLYIDGMGVAIGPNTVIVDNATVCNTPQYTIRGRSVSIHGGTMTGVSKAGSIHVGSMDVSWVGTEIHAVGDPEGGIINIQSQGLTTYIDNRSDYFGSYKPMENIRVDVTINMPATAQTYGVGIRLYTDTSDANFPDGQMRNVNLNGTVINNPKYGVLNFANMGRNIKLDGMILNGKPFTETSFGTQGTDDTSTNAAFLTDSTASFTVDEFIGWTIYNVTDGSSATVTDNDATTIDGTLSGGTDDDWDSSDAYLLIPPMNSLAAIAVDDSLTDPAIHCTMRNNTIYGFEYVMYDYGGTGSAGTMHIPWGIQNNRMDYIYKWDTAAFRAPEIENMFTNNNGRYFIDRTGWFTSKAIQNSLWDGHTANTDRKNCITIEGAADVRAYYDDAGSYKAL